MEYIETTQVAKLVREELKKAFPGIVFSVKSHKYSGGSSIHVGWINGPTDGQVSQVAGRFHGSDFDGMQDLKTDNGRPYGNDYIFFERRLTEEILLAEAQRIIKNYALPLTANDLDKYDKTLWEKFQHGTLRQIAWQSLRDKNLQVQAETVSGVVRQL